MFDVLLNDSERSIFFGCTDTDANATNSAVSLI